MAGTKTIKEQAQFLQLNEFGGLELLKARYHRQCFSPHVHETFCIGVIEEGAQRFYRSGGEHVAPKGDIILVNADDVHTGRSEFEGGWAYRAIYPHPELLRSISRDIRNPNGDIPWFPDAVLHDPGLSEQLLMTFNLLSQQGNTLLKETLLLSSLTWLMMRYGKTPQLPRKLLCAEQRIRMVKELIDSCPEKELSLSNLADIAGLSPWHFLRQFKSMFGMPPHAYLVQARLRKAKQLLLKGQPIITVAAHCSFTDQSHFHRHFKNSFGITPGEFVRGSL